MFVSKKKSLQSLDSIFIKASKTNTEITIGSILKMWGNQKTVTVHFVYFANIWLQGLLGTGMDTEKSTMDARSGLYANELQGADFLLPDGIAFRLLHFAYFHPNISRLKILGFFGRYSKESIPNMNGTDFVPKFLGYTATKIPNARVVLFGSREKYSQVLIKKIQFFGFRDVQYCDGYGEFDVSLLKKGIPNILLVGLGSPKQELWIAKYRNTLELHSDSLLILSVGGLFDFWSGVEKRAPNWMRKISLEWLWRSITNPKKNLKKTLISFYFFWVLLFVR